MPKTLRSRLLLLIILVIAVPVLVTGYFLTLTAEKALIAEKERKLFGAANLLDKALVGSYHDIIASHGLTTDTSKEIQIAVMNRELREITDQVAAAYPGIGVGFYSKELDAILTYGPSHTYGNTVGRAIGQSHGGRMVMETGAPRVQEGSLVRGMIMNAMIPVVREEKVIGYIWANEMTADIEQQIGSMKKKIYFLLTIGIILGITGVFHVINRIVADVDKIKTGLRALRGNFPETLPLMPGEIGEIALAINDLMSYLAEKKKLQEQVQHAEQLATAGEIAASLAHEIRNPLMAIKGFAQLLSETRDQNEVIEYIDIIIKETDRMNRLIEQLLCLARPAADTVTAVTVDVIAALDNALLLLEAQARRNHIVIERSYGSNIPTAIADSENLKQVFLNIILNAIQAMEAGGQLTIAADYQPEEQLIHIRIKDSGVGIQPDMITRLFDPFFTTKEKGTGLGLSVAQRFVHNWGGKISIDSTVGVGSQFTVTLPAAENAVNANGNHE